MSYWVCSIYDFFFVYCICLIVREKKLRVATKQCIFYVTVRSRSESRAWPIFGAPWRQCFSSMHWKTWRLLFMTIFQILQCIRKLNCDELTSRHTEVHMSCAHAASRQCYGMYPCRITFHSHTLLAQVKFLNVSKYSLFPHHNSDFNKVFKYSLSTKPYIVQTAAVFGFLHHQSMTHLPLLSPTYASPQGASLDSCCCYCGYSARILSRWTTDPFLLLSESALEIAMAAPGFKRKTRLDTMIGLIPL